MSVFLKKKKKRQKFGGDLWSSFLGWEVEFGFSSNTCLVAGVELQWKPLGLSEKFTYFQFDAAAE